MSSPPDMILLCLLHCVFHLTGCTGSKYIQWHTRSRHKLLPTRETEVQQPGRDRRKPVITNEQLLLFILYISELVNMSDNMIRAIICACLLFHLQPDNRFDICVSILLLLQNLPLFAASRKIRNI